MNSDSSNDRPGRAKILSRLAKNKLIIEGLIFLFLSIFILISSTRMRGFGQDFMSPGLFPALFGFLMLVLSLILIFRGIKNNRAEVRNNPGSKNSGDEYEEEITGPELAEKTEKSGKFKGGASSIKQGIDVVVITALTFIYVQLLPFLGFLITTTAYLALFMLYIGERKRWRVIAISLAFPLIYYLIFQTGLGIRLP